MEKMTGVKISIQLDGAEVYKDAPFLVDVGTDFIEIDTEIDDKKLLIKVERDEPEKTKSNK